MVETRRATEADNGGDRLIYSFLFLLVLPITDRRRPIERSGSAEKRVSATGFGTCAAPLAVGRGGDIILDSRVSMQVC